MTYNILSSPNTAATFNTFIASALIIKVRRLKHKHGRPHGGYLPGMAPNREIGSVQVSARLEEACFLNETQYNKVTIAFGPKFNDIEFEGRCKMPKVV